MDVINKMTMSNSMLCYNNMKEEELDTLYNFPPFSVYIYINASLSV